jgi:hypothetical protein
MADDDTYSAQAHDQPLRPNPALKSLDVMVDTWNVKGRESGPDGEIHGQVTFEWMEGGFFLAQRVGFDHSGQRIKGVEYIGYDESDDALTIWGGYVGSPASFKGKFSDGRNTVTGAWEWPGGGYEATITRAK